MSNPLKTVVALAAFLLLAGITGCAALRSAAKSPQVAVYECQLAVLADVIPEPAAEDLVMALRAGQHDYAIGQLIRLGLDLPRVEALAAAYNACLPANPAEPPALEGF